MRLTKFYLPTLRQAPSDCDTVSAKLMFRAGMIRKLSSGIYEWLPLGLRVLKKVEQIIREEMDKIGGLEVWLPHLLPKEPWVETGRWYVYGDELFRLKDRKGAEFCLSPTAEEIITSLVRNELRSYRQLPVMFYQFGTKFRDEIRPRFGVIRAKEFYMKDAYSFHKDETDAEEYYTKVVDAYSKIFKRCGLKFLIVEATTGPIGGKFSHEFMVVRTNNTANSSQSKNIPEIAGEETIVYCSYCNYAANIEKAECSYEISQNIQPEKLPLEEVYTPNKKTVEEVSLFLNEPPEKFIKTLVYVEPLPENKNVHNVYVVLVRGDYEINETKLKEKLGVHNIILADNNLVEQIFNVPVGFLGPINLAVVNISVVNKYFLVADRSVEYIVNGISGANKKDFHIKNINIYRDFSPDIIEDLRNITLSDPCPKCKSKSLKFSKGIEVGHTFKLGTKYSKSMNATFLDENGKEQFYVMGCYGIGVSRIVAAAIEQSYDEDGIIWYPTIAPFSVYLLPIDYKDKEIKHTTDKIYDILTKNNIEVLFDDRDERPGVKFKDADLIGCPIRITVSKKTLPDNVELYIRKTKQTKMVTHQDIVKEITATIELLKQI